MAGIDAVNWIKRIFGYRTKLAASGSLDRAHVANIAAGAVAGFGHYGVRGEIAYVANTNSMLPTLDENAVVILEACDFGDLREGDIVTRILAPDFKFTIHRLNERTGDGWWHLGDSNARVDDVPVTRANFHRRVCAIFYGRKSDQTDL